MPALLYWGTEVRWQIRHILQTPSCTNPNSVLCNRREYEQLPSRTTDSRSAISTLQLSVFADSEYVWTVGFGITLLCRICGSQNMDAVLAVKWSDHPYLNVTIVCRHPHSISRARCAPIGFKSLKTWQGFSLSPFSPAVVCEVQAAIYILPASVITAECLAPAETCIWTQESFKCVQKT